MSENLYKQKYLKYKKKYLELKGGADIIYDLKNNIIKEKQPLYIKAGVIAQKIAPPSLLRSITKGCNDKMDDLLTDEKKYKEHRKLIKEYDIDKNLIDCNEQKYVIKTLFEKKDLSYNDLEKLNTSDLQKKCLTKYNSQNEFFIRKKLGLPDINNEINNTYIVSAADAYCTMFENEAQSKEYWIKGKNFTIQNLLYGISNIDNDTIAYLSEPKNVTVMRLAPGHYHRYHCPVTGTIESIYLLGNSFYSVQPYIVNSGIDVYTENKRCVVTIRYNKDKILKMIIVGATCVGSIEFNTKLCPDNTNTLEIENGSDVNTKEPLKYNIKKNVTFSQNEELGKFNFGGSTILYIINSKDVSRTNEGEIIYKHSIDKDETSVVVGTKLFNIL